MLVSINFKSVSTLSKPSEIVHLHIKIHPAIISSLLFMFALALRLLNINTTDIAGDETFSIFMAQFDVSTIVAFLSGGNNPPLFEILLHHYMLYVGESDFLLRLFPTVLSALTVIPIFLIGDRFFNRNVAFSASAMFILSIYHIRYAHEVRVYSLFSLTAAWILYSFLSVVQKPNNFKWWVILGICNVILLYSHFTSFFILLIEGICGLCFIPIRHWKKFFSMMMVTCLSYTPYLVVFLHRLNDMSGGGNWVSKPGWGEIYGSVNLMINGRIATILVIVILILGLVATYKKDLLTNIHEMRCNRFGLVMILWFAVPYTLMFFLSMFYIPIFIDRYILYTSIPLFLTIAWMIDQSWKNARFRQLGGFLLVLTAAFTTDINPSNNRQIKSTVEHIKLLNNDSTQVFLSPDYFDITLCYHYDRDWFRELDKSNSEQPRSKVDSILNVNGIFPISEANQLKIEMTHRVIFLDAASEFIFPQNGILNQLKSQMQLVDSTHFHEIFDVYLFEKER